MARSQPPRAILSAATTRKKAAHPQPPYARQMKPPAAATLPAAIRLTPKKRRRRYSHGWIRRCRPGRGGVSHHPRRRFAAVLSLGAFIGMPPLGCGAGHPVTYQRDITLIGGLSMVAVPTGRLGGPRVGPGGSVTAGLSTR